jgi:hypothetical protein
MHRINSIGNVNNLFVDYDAINNPQGTVIDASFMNDLQEEVCNFIESRGITLVQGQQDQLELAIQDILDKKDFLKAADGSNTSPSITFASDTNTGIGHSSADTLDFVTGGVSRARISSVGLQSSVVPDLSGSNTNLFPEYKCRAWVNFNGSLSSPITPRKNGNISSITKTSTGNYTITFLNNMPDSDYIVIGSCLGGSAISYGIFGLKNSGSTNTQTTSQVQITTGYVSSTNGDGVLYDHPNIFFAVFR